MPISLGSKFVTRVQFALFFDSALESTGELAFSLYSNMKTVFDSDPTMFPVPDGLPSDVPSAFLTTTNGSASIQLSRARMDIVFESPLGDSPFSWVEERDILFRSLERFSAFGVSLSRFGCTVSFVRIVDDPVHIIGDEYLKKGLADDYEELLVRVNAPFTVNGTSYNRITTTQDGSMVVGQDFYKAIVVSVDVNTDQALEKITQEMIDTVLLSVEKVFENEKLL